MFKKHTIPATASHTCTIPYKQLCMQACYAADIAQYLWQSNLTHAKQQITQEVLEITGWIHVRKET